uniref:ABC-type uncharacterized transport system domain-containing protein n=1 Tax=Hemiselmis andersenii TaxID=464988 RepID=A0A6U2H1A7_HEMAN|mmetsp:Transcript_38765/g.90370  ORF Transcript_38765/g.90370 Transcript_38765/m.90370 type:complete len:460 (+) Transcript_38765:39-1418(+)
MEERHGTTVIFNSSKKESHHPGKNYKQFARRLKANYKVIENKDKIDGPDTDIATDSASQIAIFANPRERFNKNELGVIKKLVDDGGSVIIMLGEGGESKSGTNINALLEEYHIFVNPDCAVRTVYHKYLHPKEVFVQNGILNREITRQAKATGGKGNTDMAASLDATGGLPAATDVSSGLSFVVPYGATLNVQKPAVPLLSTGQEAYPLNRPLCALWDGTSKGQGKMLVLSSPRMFDDEWLMKEDNAKICDVFMQWMNPGEKVPLNMKDAEDEESVSEYHHVPDHAALANRMRCCLQEAEEIPQDFSSLFDETLFRFDTDCIPESLKLYTTLDVKHEQLTLIPPQFEAPLPPLQPAVFPPALREPPPPALDLFDLDEQFASERVRLAKLTNKCAEEHLEFYITQSAEILGITEKLPEGRRGAKACLEVILRELTNWKKISHDTSMGGLEGPGLGLGPHL